MDFVLGFLLGSVITFVLTFVLCALGKSDVEHGCDTCEHFSCDGCEMYEEG